MARVEGGEREAERGVDLTERERKEVQKLETQRKRKSSPKFNQSAIDLAQMVAIFMFQQKVMLGNLW